MVLMITVAVSTVALYAFTAGASTFLPTTLGRMSRQWLVEYRASQAS